MNAVSKEVAGPNAMGKHSLLSDPRIESPPKRPKSAEGKTSANEQVSVTPLKRCVCLCVCSVLVMELLGASE